MADTRKKLAVIGDPISHSLSPQMHTAAIDELCLNLEYTAIQVSSMQLRNFVYNARKDFLGFNVTVPNKIDIIKYLDKVSPEAQLGGSVNTVKIETNGTAVGYSTDGSGLESALKELFEITPQNKAFLFMGCGGAAQAASAHLLFQGAKSICFLNRNLAKAENFTKKLKEKFPKADVSFLSYDNHHKIAEYLTAKPVIIQSTSVGLKEGDPLILSEKFFIKDLCYFDMIYKPTAFLKAAHKHNCRNGNGLLMLLYQGAKSFEIWTGLKPPVNKMKAKLEEIINNANK